MFDATNRSSVFRQNHAFGSNPSQTSSSGSTFQQTQSTFGGNLCRSSPSFGGPSRPTFGYTTTSTLASGMTGTSGFSATSTPAFGATSTPAFGSTNTSAFGSSTSVFGTTGSTFGQSSAPAFVSVGAFGARSSPFGSQAAASAFGSPAFWQSSFGGRCEGSRVTSYRPTIDTDSCGKLESISAMLAYKNETHEELRWEDYRRGDKGSSVFRQNHAFRSNPSQTSPSGSTFQPTQSTFGSNLCGSSPSGRPTFGYTTTSTIASQMTGTSGFSARSTTAFGATSTPAFGSTNTPAFGSSTSASGSTGSSFGQSSAPAFVSIRAFGTTTTCAFGVPSTSALGAPTNAFSASSSSFGDSRSPSNFGSCPFGESNSSFGSSPFRATPLPFGARSSPFGNQAAASAFGSPAFWQSSFGSRCEGSRVTSYRPAIDTDSCGKLESISAMLAYKNESHEELRWEDYRRGDKGGPGTTAQPAGGIGTGTPAAQPNPFEIPSTFGQFSMNTFSYTSSSSPATSTFESISAMPADIDKSHEEFRWEDYKSGNKGGRSRVTQPAEPGGMGFGMPAAQPSPFGSSSCSICWSEPKEGVCVPCGHATACMSCLNRIQNRKCPICRSRIQQVIRIFIA